MPKTITLFKDDPEEVTVPAKYDDCPRCEGEGVHDHPAFSNGITADEWNGPDWDDESREGYLCGHYDVQCETCHGGRVVLVADEDRMTPTQKAAWETHIQNEYEIAAERRSEERWGY